MAVRINSVKTLEPSYMKFFIKFINFFFKFKIIDIV